MKSEVMALANEIYSAFGTGRFSHSNLDFTFGPGKVNYKDLKHIELFGCIEIIKYDAYRYSARLTKKPMETVQKTKKLTHVIPPSPMYGLSYPIEMCLTQLSEKQCAQPQSAEENLNETERFVENVASSGIKPRTPKDTRLTYCDEMLSVGDIPSQLLLNTGSRSYKKLTTWLKKV